MSTPMEKPMTPLAPGVTLATLESGDPSASLYFENLELRPSEFEALLGGRRVGLTRREFQVLHCLAAQVDRVLTRHDIYDQVWGGVMPHRDRSVDVFVRKVRRKLDAVAPGRVVIHTHFGVGYRFSYDDDDGAR